MLKQLDIQHADATYPVYIGTDVLDDLSIIKSYIAGNQVLIISNETVAPLYLERVCQSLQSFQIDTLILPDGECYKNQESLFAVYDCLISHHHHRDTTLIALGGGVIGDMVGFAASTYQRGVNFIQIPTSLLAQVDASVGGKTAINHRLAKNMIGSFYQPKAVIIDLLTLQTLAEREFAAGMAEVIKYAFLYGGSLVDKINQLALSSNKRQDPLLADIVYQCCAIKAEYVKADERELGVRALLNLGHTFGHAVESVTEYKQFLHGEAVAMGLYCALLLSHRLGFCELTMIEQLIGWTDSFKLPCSIPIDLDNTMILDAMRQDKKIVADTMRFIVCKTAGDCFIYDKVSEEDILAVLQMAKNGVQNERSV